MKRNLLRVTALAGLALLTSGGLARAQEASANEETLFGITFVGNQLVAIDPGTGAGRLVGEAGEMSFPYGIAARNGRLYTFDQATDKLHEINKINGKYSRTIDLNLTGLKGEGDLTFRASDGMGFLASALNANNEPVNDFYSLTITDEADVGVAVRLGSTGVAIDAMAFDDSGTLYGIGQASATLYTINPANGATTEVGPLGVAMNSPVSGMTFGPANGTDAPNGVLYASIDDRLYRINTATGHAVKVSTSVLNFDSLISSVSGLAFAPGIGTLGNMSARLHVGTDENVGIIGFIIRGTPGKEVVIRGLGPSMTNVNGVLADPFLRLFNNQGQQIGQNDDYGSSADKAAIGQFGLTPGNPKESAILRTLPAGTYTAILSGVNQGTGVGLLEVYDVDSGSGSRLVNLSARGFVDVGDNALIGGFIVSGSGTQRVVVRAIGPDLANRGISNPLSDPNIEVFDANGVLLKSNDNFSMDPDAAEIASQGLAPHDNRESATIVTAQPGNYTAVVTGVGANTSDRSGVALLESYNLTTVDEPAPVVTQ